MEILKYFLKSITILWIYFKHSKLLVNFTMTIEQGHTYVVMKSTKAIV